jgi:hypothetical protein
MSSWFVPLTVKSGRFVSSGLDNLRRDGDGYMRKLVEAMEYERAREREREDEYGRALER